MRLCNGSGCSCSLWAWLELSRAIPCRESELPAPPTPKLRTTVPCCCQGTLLVPGSSYMFHTEIHHLHAAVPQSHCKYLSVFLETGWGHPVLSRCHWSWSRFPPEGSEAVSHHAGASLNAWHLGWNLMFHNYSVEWLAAILPDKYHMSFPEGFNL